MQLKKKVPNLPIHLQDEKFQGKCRWSTCQVQCIKCHASFPGKTGNIGICWWKLSRTQGTLVSVTPWVQGRDSHSGLKAGPGRNLSLQVFLSEPDAPDLHWRWICSVLLHPFCVCPLARVPRLLLCCKEFCSELPYTFKKAVATSKTFMTHCLLITLVTVTSTQKEWQTSRYHAQTRMIQSNLLVPTETSVGKIKFWNQQTFREKQACFSVDNTDLVLTYHV